MSRVSAAFALLLAACAQPTQITFDLRTDVPCAEIQAVGLSVGPVGSVETKAPAATTTSCSASGTVSAIGTYAVVPAAGPVEVSVRVTLAEKGVTLEADCTAENKYKGCIVARRDVTFIPRRGLVVPIDLLLVCRDVACDVNTTCNRLGRCVSSKIDPNKCDGDLCEATVEPFPTGSSTTPAASPRRSSWTANPDRAAADGVASVGLTLTLRDGAGNPVVNERVAVSASGSDNRWSIPASTTNDAGVFLARLAATAAEQKTVTVSAGNIELQTQVSFTNEALPDGGAGDGGLPRWAQEAFVKASNTGVDDEFGGAVALSADGNTLAVGARLEDSSTPGVNPPTQNDLSVQSGAVYVFRRAGASWTQEAYVKTSTARSGDSFGSSVSLSADGNTLAIGAPGESSGATRVDGNQLDFSATASGAVFIFQRAGTTWQQAAYVKASNTGSADNFGSAVSLSGDGNTLAVGAYNEDSASNTVNGPGDNDLSPDSGAVYVYTRSGSGAPWAFEAYLKASNTQTADRFGFAVAVAADGNTLVAGAYQEGSNAIGVGGDQADNSANFSGASYVFVRTGAAWTQQAYLKASNTRAGAAFGSSVAISGDGSVVAVGSPSETGTATGVNGDQTGTTAALSGAVYVFRRTGPNWSQEAYLKASNTGGGDTFGFSVSLSASGNTVLVGAREEASGATGVNGNQADSSLGGAGAVYVFQKANPWAQAAYVKASNTGANDRFGQSLASSADGSAFAVGAPREASNEKGTGGTGSNDAASGSGACYAFSTGPG